MFYARYLFDLILLHSILATPNINFYYTDSISVSNSVSQHNCLRVTANIEHADRNRQIMSYCLSEFSLKLLVQKNKFFPKFTFAQLSKANVTSEQLYFWSASIESAERYQFYLNQLPTLNDFPLSSEVFYNCTLPRFGPLCQYEFDYYHPSQSSLYQIIRDYYHQHTDILTNVTCYNNLKCDRRPFASCLDWSEICDGKVDCLDGGLDEKDCRQLDMNKCNEDEFQCLNRQCIFKSFYLDDRNVPDCFDGSDEAMKNDDKQDSCSTGEPSLECEDITCDNTPLTISCEKYRRSFLLHALSSVKDSSISNDCWSAFQCLMNVPEISDLTCANICETDMCVTIIENQCPDMLFFPAAPVLYGEIYFAYQKKDFHLFSNYGFHYPYVCYKNSRYDAYFVNATKVFFNDTICYHRNDTLRVWSTATAWYDVYLSPYDTDLRIYNEMWKYNQSVNFTSMQCGRLNMYQCINSPKCIFVYEKFNKKRDCPYGDDEDPSEMDKKIADDEYMGIGPFTDETLRAMLRHARNVISFQTICDGFTELLPVIINERSETDETECEQWPCNNLYTRCNGEWNCPDGSDELVCPSSLSFNCSVDHHLCVSPNTNQLMCLPIERANDGQIDCVGATDEPKLCRSKYQSDFKNNFYCTHSGSVFCGSSDTLCNGAYDCSLGEDENFCQRNRTSSWWKSICHPEDLIFVSETEKFLCQHTNNGDKQQIIYFSLGETGQPINDQATNIENPVSPSSPIIEMSYGDHYGCYHGLPLHIWLNHKNDQVTSTCLCPPSFYGDRCQYQNQRITLSIKVHISSEFWQIPFAIVVSLIDDSNERIIHSYEQFTYLSMRDCQIKFHIYLIYSTRPKNPEKNYSIRIDTYEKISLTYQGSLLFPVDFAFLPVHRLAVIVDIPRNNDRTQRCSYHQCNHGKCIRYTNNPKNATFCQCDEGWSGRFCTIQHTCQCSAGSLCIGISANNRSICVCPIDKFGPRCLLFNPTCRFGTNSTCKNGGQCVPSDDYLIFTQNFTCICPTGFTGDRCEATENKLILSFGNEIVLSQSIFIHFIEVMNENVPRRVTTFKNILVKQNSVIVHWSQPFHLVFTELSNKSYYLAAVQKIYNRSRPVEKTIHPSDRCVNISEVFNETVFKLDLLRRIKYYHLPCQKYSPKLQCFHDEIHLCICYDFGQERLANCFTFDHNMMFHCAYGGDCENKAECFQDTLDCPKKLMCVCPRCYYGARCQFSANGPGLTLDAILGYHILPYVSLSDQPFITQMSLALTIIFFITGLINGLLCLITFKNKTAREVGCGLYLLGSSITTLLTMIMFGLKFFILLAAQMTMISNRSFLQVQCISLDFLLRVCLSADQWLNACVAVERATTILKGARFVKKKSKQIAKYSIIILILVIAGTCLHDPFHRRLVDEGNDDDDHKRTWCIISYSSNLARFNYAMHILHFVGPFIINLVSSIILITVRSQQQLHIHKQRSYKEHLREQFQQHKHLFTAPVLLVLLAIPRLIITFVSKCMNSANDSWLFLVGYFISFIPPMVTFLIFVLPSKLYQQEFRKSVVYHRTRLQRCSRCSF